MTNRMSKKIDEANKYYEAFQEFIMENDKIWSEDADDYITIGDEAETWRQAFAPNGVREIYPTCWFVRDGGPVLSMHGEPHLLPQNTDGNTENRVYYKFSYKDENGNTRTKNIEEHNLVATVFGSEVFGETAKAKLENEGVFAFGKDKDSIQGHHKDDDHGNNESQNILLAMQPVHSKLNQANIRRNKKKEIQYMLDLNDIVGKENPNSATILFTGEAWDRKTGKKIKTNKTVEPVAGSIYVGEDEMNQISYYYNFMESVNRVLNEDTESDQVSSK